MKWYLFLLLVIGGIILSCNDDNESLHPSNVQEYELVIPQGDHDYDKRIVEWFDSIGVYMLYKFNPADVYFNVSSTWGELITDTIVRYTRTPLSGVVYVEDTLAYINGQEYVLGKDYVNGSTWFCYTLDGDDILTTQHTIRTSGTFLIDEADEAYVGEQLDLLERVFLDFYPKNVLRECMPLKIILGSDLRDEQDRFPCRGFFNNLLVSYGDASVMELTEDEIQAYKGEINEWFLDQRMKYSNFSFDEFESVTDYYWLVEGTIPASSECYALGLVLRPSSASASGTWDRGEFVKMIINNSYETLVAEPEDGGYDSRDFTGILHPKKDVNGLIREKYDLLVEEFKKNGIDLQKIGNGE